ncbi:unnamed protein product [Rhodiola kirilowii]
MVSGKLKQLSDSEDSNKSPAMESSQIRRTCVDCNTTKTPLWRGGPAGPRSLCNACGIRHRKSKRALLASDERSKAKNKLKKKHTNARRCEKGLQQMRVMGVGGKMEKLIREEEEEEAAILLMALSYGYGCAATCV